MVRIWRPGPTHAEGISSSKFSSPETGKRSAMAMPETEACRAEGSAGGKKLMISVDDSEGSTNALTFALSSIATPQDTIILVHVRPEVDSKHKDNESDSPREFPSMPFLRWMMEGQKTGRDFLSLVVPSPSLNIFDVFYGTPSWLDEVERKFQERSDAILERMQCIVQEHKLKCEVVSMKGDPRSKIVEAAHKFLPSILVMGSRGHGMIKRAFLGSVSDYAAHHAECPVLIVKPHEKPHEHAKSDVSATEKLANVVQSAS